MEALTKAKELWWDTIVPREAAKKQEATEAELAAVVAAVSKASVAANAGAIEALNKTKRPPGSSIRQQRPMENANLESYASVVTPKLDLARAALHEARAV